MPVCKIGSLTQGERRVLYKLIEMGVSMRRIGPIFDVSYVTVFRVKKDLDKYKRMYSGIRPAKIAGRYKYG